MHTNHVITGTWLHGGYMDRHNPRVLVLAVADGQPWATDDCGRPEVPLRLDQAGDLRGWADAVVAFSPDDPDALAACGVAR